MRVKPKILFVGDSLSSLKLASDTSLAFCEAALNLDFEVFWCEKKDISFFNYEIVVNQPSIITKVSLNSIQHKHFTHESSSVLAFSEFTHCFIRTDPPFDESYKDLCWILNTQTKVKIYNSPSALLNFHEKSLPWRAFAEGVFNKKNIIPTCLSESSDVVQLFIKEQSEHGVQKFVTKPWLGHAGKNVTLWEDTKDMLEYLKLSKDKMMVQPFLNEIHTKGDRRVLIARNEIFCTFVRFPPEGKMVSNLAQGGSGMLLDMTPSQKDLCNKIIHFLNKHDIAFAGIDMIGEKISEINITSPTGVRAYEKFTGQKVAQKVFEAIISPQIKSRGMSAAVKRAH